jgi:hypothetical protein
MHAGFFTAWRLSFLAALGVAEAARVEQEPTSVIVVVPVVTVRTEVEVDVVVVTIVVGRVLQSSERCGQTVHEKAYTVLTKDVAVVVLVVIFR